MTAYFNLTGACYTGLGDTGSKLASTPGRPLREGRPGIDCLRMRRIFRILTSKLDRKLNHPRRARTTLRSKVNIYGIIIQRVYREYTITRFLG